MTVSDALQGVVRLGLDTSPIIIFVERPAVLPGQTDLFPVCRAVFAAARAGAGGQSQPALSLVASVLTRTETLVKPLRTGDGQIAAHFRALLTGTAGIDVLPIEAAIADQAADLRARYNLKTPDALHVATALVSGCDAFLTGDRQLQRVTEIRVIVLGDLTL